MYHTITLAAKLRRMINLAYSNGLISKQKRARDLKKVDQAVKGLAN